MERTEILQTTAARFLGFAEGGTIFAPDLVEFIKGRYKFWESPKGPEEWDLEKGVRFTYGTYGGELIDNLQVFGNGMLVQARANTAILDGMIDDILESIGAEFGIVFEGLKPVHKRFSSTLEFRSDAPLLLRIGHLDKVSAMLSEMVSDYGITAPLYEGASIALQTDGTKAGPVQPGRFLIERRANQPFESGLFFSEAPVTTEQHEQLIEEFERSL